MTRHVLESSLCKKKISIGNSKRGTYWQETSSLELAMLSMFLEPDLDLTTESLRIEMEILIGKLI